MKQENCQAIILYVRALSLILVLLVVPVCGFSQDLVTGISPEWGDIENDPEALSALLKEYEDAPFFLRYMTPSDVARSPRKLCCDGFTGNLKFADCRTYLLICNRPLRVDCGSSGWWCRSSSDKDDYDTCWCKSARGGVNAIDNVVDRVE